MSEPLPLTSPRTQEAKADLWSEAPGWRNLVLTATFLTVTAVVAPVVLRESIPAAPPQVAPAPTAIPALRPKAAPIQVAPVQPQPAPATLPVVAAPPRIVYVPVPAGAPREVPTPAAPAAQALAQAAPAPDTVACTLRGPAAPAPMGAGSVTGFENRSVSQARIQLVQAQSGGRIDPDYADNLRVIVQMDNGKKWVLLAPKAMPIRIGDRVTAQGGYLNARLPCNYIPNLITADLGPGQVLQGAAPAPAP